jgi:hypothetical protein
MNAYQNSTPRTLIAFAAAALAAATLGLTVLAPAAFDAASADMHADSARRTPATPIEVAIVPGRIEVIGIREPEVAASCGKAVGPAPASRV